MEWLRLLFCLVVIASCTTVTQCSTCHDLDPQACVLMHHANPNLCQDLTLAESACPRFCNLCPMECYHCNTTMSDYHTCNTTKMCAQNEVCMQKVVTSTFDGHHAYQLSCERKDRCDGSDLVVSFGKRGVDVRDVSISCCLQDRCNYPGSSTQSTTNPPPAVCRKDVFIVFDNDRGVDLDVSAVSHFLETLIYRLPISPDGVHVSVSYATSHLHPILPLDAHTDTNGLATAIHHDLLRIGDKRDVSQNLDASISALRTLSANRADAGDILITITDNDDGHLHTGHVMRTFAGQFEKVIAIGVGGDGGENGGGVSGGFSSAQGEVIITGRHGPTLYDIVPRVTSLICPATH